MSCAELQKTSLEQAISLANEAVELASRCLWDAAVPPSRQDAALAAYLAELFLLHHGRMRYIAACLRERVDDATPTTP